MPSAGKCFGMGAALGHAVAVGEPAGAAPGKHRAISHDGVFPWTDAPSCPQLAGAFLGAMGRLPEEGARGLKQCRAQPQVGSGAKSTFAQASARLLFGLSAVATVAQPVLMMNSRCW
jgi:hypothetical protein